MANSYSQMYIHAVFAVKYREARIQKSLRPKLMAVIGNLINETECETLIVNGVEDHVHCFFRLLPKISVSDVLKNCKAKSSKWLNENSFFDHRFEWQKGFGCFSCSKKEVPKVYQYILNQEIHHRSQSFRIEYMELLQEHEISFDEHYIFEEMI